MHGDRRQVLGKIRRRAKRLRGQIPWGVSRQFDVSTTRELVRAHRLASVLASPTRRVTIQLRPGTYRTHLECSVGVDIEGPKDAVVEWDGPHDTIDANGTDTRLRGFTVKHLGPEFFYAIHADSPGPGGAQFLDLDVYSDSKSAIGFALQPGQGVTIRGCRFERGAIGATSEPVLAHTSPLGGEGPWTVEDCTAFSATGERLSVFIDMVTGEQFEIPGVAPEPAPRFTYSMTVKEQHEGK